MNFFQHQEAAKKRSAWLVVLFTLAVIGIIFAVYLVVAVALNLANQGQRGMWNGDTFAGVAAAVLAIIGIGSLYKAHQLRQGGARAVAMMMGGVPVLPNTTDRDERRLINVVEEMAIASGTPVPAIYLLPSEPGINAFAAGYTPADAAVGVTRGCIQKLTRDELQGVIAHEFSHILHGDMRLNIRLIGLLNGILAIALLGYFTLRVVGSASRGSRNSKAGGAIAAIALIGLALMAVGYIGLFFGRIIKAGVSRQREFLADASAVQFTRQPAGIAGALKKIGGFTNGSRVDAPHAEEASHMFFGNMRAKRFVLFNGLFSTHPPLDKRIRAIEPGFDGSFPAIGADFYAEPLQEGPAIGLGPGGPGAASAMATAPTGEGPPSRSYSAADLIDSAGAPTARHLAYSTLLLSDLPESLREAAHEPLGAQAIALALLLSSDDAVMALQVAHLEASREPLLVGETLRLAPTVGILGRPARLPLIDLALPSLRQLSPAQNEAFVAAVRGLIEADEKVDLFEFTLQKVLLRNLRQATNPRPVTELYKSLRPLREECRILLSTVAYAGHAELDLAQAAFTEAARTLAPELEGLTPCTPQACRLPAIDAALESLYATSPAVKHRILSACAASVAHDGQVTPTEAELLRAVADSLNVPLPPLVSSYP